MSNEALQNQNLPAQPDTPKAVEIKEDKDESTIKVKKHKNSERGTELIYVLIPTEKSVKLNVDEVRNAIEQYYGSTIDYEGLTKQIQDFSLGEKPFEVAYVIDKEDPRKYVGDFGRDHYLTLKKIGKNIALIPTPAIHDITKGQYLQTKFEGLIGILSRGFKNSGSGDNSYIKKDKEHRYNEWGIPSSGEEEITHGDKFSVELFPNTGTRWVDPGSDPSMPNPTSQNLYEIETAKPENVLSVNIRLCPAISEEQKEAKMSFYKRTITDAFKIPVRFYETTGEVQEHISVSGTKQLRILNQEVTKRVFKKKKQQEELGGK